MPLRNCSLTHPLPYYYTMLRSPCMSNGEFWCDLKCAFSAGSWQTRTRCLKKVAHTRLPTTERRVPELIPVLGSQPAGDVSHKPGSRLPLLSATPAVTPATLKRAATNFAAWWTEAWWVWTVCLRLLPDSVATAVWTRALLRPSPAR